jgi:hypothetical protein
MNPETVTFRGVTCILTTSGRSIAQTEREVVHLSEIGKRGQPTRRGYVAHRLPTGEIVNARSVRW